MDESNLKKTHLSDPVTLYLALHPEEIIISQAQEISFPCLDEGGRLKPEYSGLWYNKPGLDNKLMIAHSVKDGRVKFVEQVRAPELIRDKIISSIRKYVR